MASAAFAPNVDRLRPATPISSERQRAIGDMQAFLARTHPQTPAEALRLLRNAYPDMPLNVRAAACGLAA